MRTLPCLFLLVACAGQGALEVDDDPTRPGASTPPTTSPTTPTPGTTGGTGTGTGTGTTASGSLQLTADARVIDPKLAGDPTLVVRVSGTCTAVPDAVDAAGTPAALADMGGGVYRFEGRAASGEPLQPGPVTVDAMCADGTVADPLELWVARLGPVAIDFTGPSEGTGGHVSVAWHKTDRWAAGLRPLWDGTPEWANGFVDGSAGDLDDDDGMPAPAPMGWAQTHFPPWGAAAPPSVGDGSHSVPAAYISGTTPWLVVTPGTTAVGADGQPQPALGTEAGAPELRLAPDGWLTEDRPWAPGDPLVLEAAAPLPDLLGHHHLALTWRWEARLGDGDWAPVPGHALTEHPLYLLYDAPTLQDGTGHGDAPPLPWFAVLDELATALDGVPPEPHAVLDGIHGYIHYHPNVLYNPSVRAYSAYEGDYVYWDRITFDLTSWLDHAEGSALYCHSVSCLFSVLAGSVGVATDQIIVGHDFRTHLLNGAGTGEWESFWFYSHSVVSPDLGATVWDAAASSDSDGDPDALPASFSPNVGLPLDDYLAGLTAYPIDIVSWNDCFVR
ncbi:MAG: hypothetical protein ACI8PZ_001591 [Myxococcota bacterium]|jgi:hypothetical protein